MKLDEYLKKSGLSKTEVADLCGVTRSALTGWDLIPEKHESALNGELENIEFKNRVVKVPSSVRNLDSFDNEEIQYLCHLRGGCSGTREPMDDYDIARGVGLTVVEFNVLIERFATAINTGLYKRLPMEEVIGIYQV